jgi:hypothetical protein
VFHQINLNELLARPRSRRSEEYANEMPDTATSSPRIPDKHTYVAADAAGVQLLACFPLGIEDTLSKTGVIAADQVTTNTESFVKSCPPKYPNNSRYATEQKWQEENGHNAHFGKYEWALRQELGHRDAGPTI